MPASALRTSPDPTRLDHQPLVRLLLAHALGRRTHQTTGEAFKPPALCSLAVSKQDHAHLHFVSGVGNPIGIKVSEKATPEELLSLLEVVNPDNIPGRVVVIVRMGAEKLRANLPKLIRAVQREGFEFTFCILLIAFDII
jgi:hypothetical protein